LTLAQRILAILQRDAYARIPDFAWLLSVLVDLAYVARAPIGAQLRDALVDVCLRVRAVRPYASQLMVRVLADASSFVDDDGDGCGEVLWAAAWIVGEYRVEQKDAHRVIGHLIQPSIKFLPADTIAVFLQSAMKVFGYWAAEVAAEWNDAAHLGAARRMADELSGALEPFTAHADVEVQERAANIVALLAFLRADLAAHTPQPVSPRAELDPDAYGFAEPEPQQEIGSLHFPKSLLLLQPLFSTPDFGPVAPDAQASVPLPVGIDLDAWIVPPPAPVRPVVEKEDYDEPSTRKNGKAKTKGKGKEKENGEPVKKKKKRDVGGTDVTSPQPLETPEERAERERKKAERLERMRDDPYYIVDDRPKRQTTSSSLAHDIDSIPVVKLELTLPSTPAAPSIPSIRASDVVVDRTGYTPSSRGATPTPTPVPALDTTNDAPSTPEPIKVVRAKKKKTAGPSKKSSVAVE
ncbi:hypothetical protein EXIGLDRAFT_764838, partial [Exidia glandulosa HHB12029]